MNKQTVSFQIEQPTLEKLKKVAEDEQRSLASLIRIACRKYLNLPTGSPGDDELETECK